MWGPYTVELSGSHDRFSLVFLFFLAAYILLCWKSSLSCRFRRWLDPSGLEWWSTGYVEGECAPLQGRRLVAWEGGLITLHAHSLSSLVIRFSFFLLSLFLSLFALSLPPTLSPTLLVPHWIVRWMATTGSSANALPAWRVRDPDREKRRVPKPGLCFAFLAFTAVKGGSSKTGTQRAGTQLFFFIFFYSSL